MNTPPPCPTCGSTTAVRPVTWLGVPRFVCDDCARGGRGADAYFDCPECGGSGIKRHGYIADVGECMTSCRCKA